MTALEILTKAARDHGWTIDRLDPNGPGGEPFLRVSRGSVEVRVWFSAGGEASAFALRSPSLAGHWDRTTCGAILTHLEA